MPSSPLFRDFQSTVLFADRHEAGEKLAKAISAEIEALQLTGQEVRPIVYALPRGGLPIAQPVAQWLHCPLSVIVAKKITRPSNPELAIGAVTADGHVLWANPEEGDPENSDLWAFPLHQAHEQAKAQLAQFSEVAPPIPAEGAIALLVDDGIATGMTIAVAAQAIRAQNPAQVWLCAPIAPAILMPFLEQWGDRVIVLETPDPFHSVSRFYSRFNQVPTEEALHCLHQAD